MSDAPAPPPPPPAPPIDAPPAPAPPPPAPTGGGDRSALLNSIQNFSKGKLKKAQTRDASEPITSRSASEGGGGGGGPSSGGNRAPPGGGATGYSNLFGPGGVQGARANLRQANKVPGPIAPGQRQTAVARNTTSFPKPRSSLYNQFNVDPEKPKPATSSAPPPAVNKPAPQQARVEPPKPVVQQQPKPVVQQQPRVEPPKPVVQQQPKPIAQQQPRVEPPKPVVQQQPRVEPPKPVVQQQPRVEPKPVVQQQPRVEAPKPAVTTPPKQSLYDQFNTPDEDYGSSSHDVHQTFTCYSCKSSIVGQFFEALGRKYHNEHWTCTRCFKPLGGEFYAPNQEPLCEGCYHKDPGRFPICGKCGRNITDAYITRESSTFHVECLGMVCQRCSRPIRGDSTRALDANFHSECFTCQRCNRELGETFIENKGELFCLSCGPSASYSNHNPLPSSSSSQGSIFCASCGQKLTGSFKEMDGKSYHDHCFTCHQCRAPLGTTFYELRGNYVCHNCMNSQASCSVCFKSITGQFVEALDQKFHPQCFKCHKCNASLDDGFYEKNGHAVCERCG